MVVYIKICQYYGLFFEIIYTKTVKICLFCDFAQIRGHTLTPDKSFTYSLVVICCIIVYMMYVIVFAFQYFVNICSQRHYADCVLINLID